MRLRLIDDWHLAWKWSSVRLVAASVAIQTALLAFPDKLAQYVPQPVLSTLATIALLVTVLAGVGRITTTEASNEPAKPAD